MIIIQASPFLWNVYMWFSLVDLSRWLRQYLMQMSALWMIKGRTNENGGGVRGRSVVKISNSVQ